MNAEDVVLGDFTAIKFPTDPVDIEGESEVKPVIDPTFLNDNPEWKAAREQVDSNINDLTKWDALVVLTEQLLVKYPSPTAIVKETIKKTFDELLSRFPLFFGYWKKYVSLVYQIYGIDESVNVLSRSLDAFPQSLELWLDYMTISISNFSDDKQKIRSNFDIGLKFVGNQFLSHPLWDKLLEFEQNEKNITGVVQILLKVIRIPLHQYSKYYQLFLTTKQSLGVDEIIKLEESLVIPENSTPEEKTKIVDDYFNQVFLTTQSYVADIWAFESQIKQSYFNLAPVPESEFTNWDAYLNYQINRYRQTPSSYNKAQTISTFERSIIPTALYPKFWYKYLDWYLDNFPEELSTLSQIYSRAVNLFLPVKFIDIRLNYALFLQLQLDKANREDVNKLHDVYLSIIKYVPTNNKPILKYIRFISSLNGDHKKTVSDLEHILALYFGKIKDGKDASQQEQQPQYIKRFSKLLNSKTVALVVVELIKINWLLIKNHLNVKKLLNYYSKFEEFSGSVPFWSMNYRYSKQYRDFKALTKTTDFIKNQSSLPLSIINIILEDYSEFLATNQIETTSIFEVNNYSKILNLEYERSSLLEFRTKNDVQLRKRQKKQSGHPGVFLDKPEVTNTIIEQLAPRFRPSGLPTFKNAEKASLPIEYTPDE